MTTYSLDNFNAHFCRCRECFHTADDVLTLCPEGMKLGRRVLALLLFNRSAMVQLCARKNQTVEADESQTPKPANASRRLKLPVLNLNESLARQSAELKELSTIVLELSKKLSRISNQEAGTRELLSLLGLEADASKALLNELATLSTSIVKVEKLSFNPIIEKLENLNFQSRLRNLLQSTFPASEANQPEKSS